MKTIIITGPSSSGKTYLTNKLSMLFSDSIIIKTDSYYRDSNYIRILSKFMYDIYDRPVSIKRNKIMNTIFSIYNKDHLVPLHFYDFINKKSSISNVKMNYNGESQFLILEGIFSHCLDLNYLNTINIVCDEDKKICLDRRIIRDQLERGRNTREIKLKFNKSWNLFHKNIKQFIDKYSVISINPTEKISYEKLITTLQKEKP